MNIRTGKGEEKRGELRSRITSIFGDKSSLWTAFALRYPMACSGGAVDYLTSSLH